MSQDHSSPDHSGRSADDVHAEQLLRLERQLRKHHPRAPQLDLEAIEQAARDRDVPVDLPVELPAKRHGHTGRWIGVIAGSWICGAAAGALVMFAVLHSSGPGLVTANPTVAEEVIDPTSSLPKKSDRPAEDQLVRHDDHDQSQSQWNRFPSLSTVVFEPYRYSKGSHRPTLRAGAHLRRFGTVHPDRRESPDDTAISTHRDEFDRVTNPRAQPSIRREQMLKELLNNDFGSTL